MTGPHVAPAASGRLTSLCIVLCLCLFALGGTLTLLWAQFPTAYDELQHLSFIHALRDAPTLFPHYGAYHVLSEDLRGWTDGINYIAHPPLYYLLLAPFGDHVILLRAMNLAMALAGLALCAGAGVRLLATEGQRVVYLLVLMLFSKPALIAGMINNDNLVLLETGVLLHLLVSPAPRPLAIAVVLALAGWTKFNAFVGLALWTGLLHTATIGRGENSIFSRASFVLLAGVLCGAVPALVNLVTIGSVAYVPKDFLFVDAAVRPNYDVWQFLAAFLHKTGSKIVFMDGLVDLMPGIGLLMLVAACAGFAPLSHRARDIAVAAWFAMFGFAMLHIGYGWNSFRTLGSMSDAQSRYYVMLWPGFALAAAMGASALRDMIARRLVLSKPGTSSDRQTPVRD